MVDLSLKEYKMIKNILLPYYKIAFLSKISAFVAKVKNILIFLKVPILLDVIIYLHITYGEFVIII